MDLFVFSLSMDRYITIIACCLKVMGHGVSRVLEFHDEWFLELCLNPFWLYHIVVSRFNNASI